MRLLISACLLGVRCKYDGGSNLCPWVLALADHFELIPVCPEQLGGLPTPRPPAERLEGRVVTRQGDDVTGAYRRGAEEAAALALRLGCAGAILKARSPSCGAGGIYDGSFSHRCVPGDGCTVQALRRAGLPVWTEEERERFEGDVKTIGTDL